MSRVRHLLFGLAVATAAVAAPAQIPAPVPPRFSPASTNLLPPIPTVPSPVAFFRQLLAMSPAERNRSLTNRPPAIRARILKKIREYQALDPNERELRLRATELRWYLTPLMRLPPAERGPGLAQMPPDLRELAQSRLAQWDLLPLALQQEFLANDKALHYFARVQTSDPPAPTPEQQRIADQFNQWFEFTPAEKQRLLGTLSTGEREQMEKTLKTFDQLPARQRALCIRNYAKFAGMSGAERAQFLKNAESWARMSPAERQTWRDLVDHVPLWPPMPPPAMPPVPHGLPRMPRANMATN